MKIDAIRKKSFKRNSNRSNEKEFSMKCYNCDTEKHIAKNCNKSKKSKSKLKIAAIQIESKNDHDDLNWTFCYDDTCWTHLSEKKKFEWFSKKSRKQRKQRICVIRERTTKSNLKQNAQKREILKTKSIALKKDFDDINSKDLNDYKLVFNEYLSKARDLMRSMNVTIEDMNCKRDHERAEIKKMLKDLNRIHSKMIVTSIRVKKFEKENAKLIREMSSFDNIYFDIYKMLTKRNKWSEYEKRLRKLQSQLTCTTMILKSEKYRDIVKKHSIKKSRFIIVKEYVILKEVHISRELRQEIERLREKYAQQNSRKHSKKRMNIRKFKFLKKKRKNVKKLNVSSESSKNNETSKTRICASSKSENFIIKAKINDTKIIALVNIEIIENFISSRFRCKTRLKSKQITSYQTLNINDDSLNEVINRCVAISIRVETKKTFVEFDETHIDEMNIILEMSWLRENRSQMNWKKVILKWDKIKKTSIKAMSKKTLKSMIKEQFDNVAKIWIKMINSNEIKKISSQYRKYKVLFQKKSFEEALISHQSWDHEIKLKSKKSSTKKSIYSLTQEKLKALRKYIDENLTKKIIKESQSSTDYSILFVSKKDEKQRLCVDYRELNNITIKNNYSLFLIEEIQDKIVDVKIFIKFDISRAYNRIRIKKENEWKIAFRTRLEHFEYLVMSFELTNASATFQTYINNVLRKYLNKFVIVYLDDILVYFKTKKKHVHHVQKVLEAMKRVNLRVKLEKSEFHKEEVKFLDHILFSTEIKSNSKRLEAILTWSVLKKLVKVQFFVRLTNYDRKFVKEYSIIAKSLTKLIKKTQSFEWDKKQK